MERQEQNKSFKDLTGSVFKKKEEFLSRIDDNLGWLGSVRQAFESPRQSVHTAALLPTTPGLKRRLRTRPPPQHNLEICTPPLSMRRPLRGAAKTAGERMLQKTVQGKTRKQPNKGSDGIDGRQSQSSHDSCDGAMAELCIIPEEPKTRKRVQKKKQNPDVDQPPPREMRTNTLQTSVISSSQVSDNSHTTSSSQDSDNNVMLKASNDLKVPGKKKGRGRKKKQKSSVLVYENMSQNDVKKSAEYQPEVMLEKNPLTVTSSGHDESADVSEKPVSNGRSSTKIKSIEIFETPDDQSQLDSNKLKKSKSPSPKPTEVRLTRKRKADHSEEYVVEPYSRSTRSQSTKLTTYEEPLVEVSAVFNLKSLEKRSSAGLDESEQQVITVGAKKDSLQKVVNVLPTPDDDEYKLQAMATVVKKKPTLPPSDVPTVAMVECEVDNLKHASLTVVKKKPTLPAVLVPIADEECIPMEQDDEHQNYDIIEGTPPPPVLSIATAVLRVSRKSNIIDGNTPPPPVLSIPPAVFSVSRKSNIIDGKYFKQADSITRQAARKSLTKAKLAAMLKSQKIIQSETKTTKVLSPPISMPTGHSTRFQANRAKFITPQKPNVTQHKQSSTLKSTSKGITPSSRTVTSTHKRSSSNRGVGLSNQESILILPSNMNAHKEDELKKMLEREEEATKKRNEFIRKRQEEQKKKQEARFQRVLEKRVANEREEEEKKERQEQKEEKMLEIQKIKEHRLKDEAMKKNQLMTKKAQKVQEQRMKAFQKDLENKIAVKTTKTMEPKTKVLPKESVTNKKVYEKKISPDNKGEPTAPTQAPSQDTQQLDSTFVMQQQTPAKPTATLTSVTDNYVLTPNVLGGDPPQPIGDADDYGVSEVESDDATDDEDEPKKHIPLWAKNRYLQDHLIQSQRRGEKAEDVFPTVPMTIDLSEIFPRGLSRPIKRTSSAVWTLPPKRDQW